MKIRRENWTPGRRENIMQTIDRLFDELLTSNNLVKRFITPLEIVIAQQMDELRKTIRTSAKSKFKNAKNVFIFDFIRSINFDSIFLSILTCQYRPKNCLLKHIY